MENTSTLVGNVFTNAGEYIALKSKSIKYDVYEKATSTAASTMSGSILFVIVFLAVLFLNIALAFAFGELLNSTKLGFLALGGIYVFVAAIYLVAKKQIDEKLRDNFVVKITKNQYTAYDELVMDSREIDIQLERTEIIVKTNVAELKENLNSLIEDMQQLNADVKKFRNIFGGDSDKDDKNNQTGHAPEDTSKASTFKKITKTVIKELLINRLLLKNSHPLKSLILPILAKTFNTNNKQTASGVDSTDSTTKSERPLLSTLKSVLAKFL